MKREYVDRYRVKYVENVFISTKGPEAKKTKLTLHILFLSPLTLTPDSFDGVHLFRSEVLACNDSPRGPIKHSILYTRAARGDI